MIKIVDTTHTATDTNEEGYYIPKSYQFERDIDTSGNLGNRFDNLDFDEQANTHFVHHDIDELVNDKSQLLEMIKRFIAFQVERLDILDKYSKGDNYSITAGRRRIENEKSDYRISHNWGGYVSNFITGYLLGKPVTISNIEKMKEIADINWQNDIDTLNYELGFDTSRYGRAFELHYRWENGTNNIVLIDPKEMFVIRDVSVTKEIIGAVHCPKYNDKYYVTVYTTEETIKFQPMEVGATVLVEESRTKHDYQDVPVVEWWNNRFRTGDFEAEIPLIDAYDAAQSDTANYMSDLNDALLVINGDLNSAGIGIDDAVAMKKANMLLLESGIDHTGKQTNLSANYIYKQYDVAGTEAYKTRLMNDIYKLSKVPNLDDDHFNQTLSGVAMKYKLIGLDQIRVTKESFYTRALRRRYELISNIHKSLGDTPINADELEFTFHTNIPQDIWQEITQFINAGGDISQETLRELASFTDNETESERILKETLGADATDEEIGRLNGDKQ